MRLHLANALADRDGTANLRLDVLCAGQVIGMRMGLKYPLQPQLLFVHVLNDDVRGRRVEATRHHRVAHDRVDDSCVAALLV